MGRGTGVVLERVGTGLGVEVALRCPESGDDERRPDSEAETEGDDVEALGRAALGSADGLGDVEMALALGDTDGTGGSVGAPSPTTSAGPATSAGASSPPE